jgi:hypothetical protein
MATDSIFSEEKKMRFGSEKKFRRNASKFMISRSRSMIEREFLEARRRD